MENFIFCAVVYGPFRSVTKFFLTYFLVVRVSFLQHIQRLNNCKSFVSLTVLSSQKNSNILDTEFIFNENSCNFTQCGRMSQNSVDRVVLTLKKWVRRSVRELKNKQISDASPYANFYSTSIFRHLFYMLFLTRFLLNNTI